MKKVGGNGDIESRVQGVARDLKWNAISTIK
jgi:hypothetical protein